MAELETLINEPSEAEKRIKQLSGKVKEEAEARAVSDQAKADAEARAVAAEKRAQFSEGFADLVAENPSAKEFKADIEAKVMSGMTIEDAKFAVLGKAGKLGVQTVETASPTGGSATTTITNQGQKSIEEMSTEEKRSALAEALGNRL